MESLAATRRDDGSKIASFAKVLPRKCVDVLDFAWETSLFSLLFFVKRLGEIESCTRVDRIFISSKISFAREKDSIDLMFTDITFARFSKRELSRLGRNVLTDSISTAVIDA